MEIKVINPETGLAVLPDQPGELCTRGHTVMLGYWPTHPTPSPLTAEAVDSARGWIHTGDLATMDDEGYRHRRAYQGHDHSRR